MKKDTSSEPRRSKICSSKKKAKKTGDETRSQDIAEEKHKKDNEIKRLIEERRSIPNSDQQQLKEVSKRIKKCARNKNRAKRKEMTQQILEQFRGIKNISQIKSAKKKTLIPKMRNAKGETVTSRKGIANVFGEFYGKLYAEEEDVNEEYDHCRADKNTSSRGQKSVFAEQKCREWGVKMWISTVDFMKAFDSKPQISVECAPTM